MMGKVWRLLLLALLLNTVLATVALARSVYLSDGGIIQAQKVWQEEGRIYVLLNRDSLISFSPEEIDLKKTFAQPRQKTTPGKKRTTTKASAVAAAAAADAAVKPAAASTPAAPPVPAQGQAADKVSTSASPAPAPALPAPVAKKPAPAPRPVATALPAEIGSEMGLVFLGVGLLFLLILIAAFWKVFEKAGEAGWKSLIPLYNLYVLLRIAGCPGWWLLMFFLPVINIYFTVVMHIRLAAKFGKGALYGFALCFLGFIFFPLLGFGSAIYEGEEFTFDEE
jgi:hypothetical protein